MDLPEDELRREIVDMVRTVAGVSFQGLDCRERPCRAAIHASSPAAFDELLSLAHARYRGHILVTATVDHPGAPARVVGDVHIGVADVIDEPTIGFPR